LYTPLDMTTIMSTDYDLDLRFCILTYLCKCILFMLINLCIFSNVSFKDPHMISFLLLYNVPLFYPFLSLIVLNSFVCYLNALLDKSVERDFRIYLPGYYVTYPSIVKMNGLLSFCNV
jgi:hypothetical protein